MVVCDGSIIIIVLIFQDILMTQLNIEDHIEDAGDIFNIVAVNFNYF